MANRDTIPEARVAVRGPQAPLDEAFAERYQSLALIGQGGMGEVRLCRDERIGRDVAMKVVRALGPAGPPDQQQRFLREARVQGQLEHPAIVPVYDLGRDPGGTPYFTMKRVNGATLEEILDRQARDDPAALREYTRHKLLTAFASVCLALDYAHARGVLHRDLKPANVMLGHFGEVYLLDWGLARIGGDEGTRGSSPTIAVADGQTLSGSILGTPNYMSPEQVRGETKELDARSDVYSLGAILYEILALETLCTGDSLTAILAETVHGVDARASMRRPARDVPPELEAICVRATCLDPEERYASARELSDAIERFLDGDRDLGLRRDLAARHAHEAHAAAERAIADVRDLDARRTALREVGRALALDAENPAALRTFVRLLTQPPTRLPASAEIEVMRAEIEGQRDAARVGFWAYSSWFLFLPLVAWMGMKSPFFFMLPAPFWIAASYLSRRTARNPHPQGKLPYPLMIASTLTVATMTVFFGPFVLLPSIATVTTISFMNTHDKTRRPAIIVCGIMTILAPLGLEVAGVLPATYRFENDALTISSIATHLPVVPAKLFLLAANLVVVVTAALLTGRMRDVLTNKERQLYLHAWQLRQLVPDEVSAQIRTPEVDPRCPILSD